MMTTPPAPRFVTCCWLVLVAALLVGPTITSNSGAHAAPVAQTRVAHWNFNNGLTSGTAYALPISASSGSGSATSNFAAADVQTFGGTGTINLVSGDTGGQDLAMVNNANNGNYLDFTFNSVGYIDITLTLALRRTSTGFSSVAVQTNGVTRTSIAPSAASTYELMTVDLSAYAEIENNPTAVVRFVFTGATMAAGNNRLDNVQFLGTAAAASASPSPTASTSVSPTTSPSPFPIVHGLALAFRDLVGDPVALALLLAQPNCVAFRICVSFCFAQLNCVAFAQRNSFALSHTVGFYVAVVIGIAIAIAFSFDVAFRLGLA